MIYKLAHKITKHWLRKNLGKTSFAPILFDYKNIVNEGLNFGNDERIEIAENYLITHLSQFYSSPLVIDVGANMGEYSQKCLRGFLSPQIYAIEPCSSSFAQLSIVLNSQVSLHQIALSDFDGNATMYISEANNKLNSLIKRTHSKHYWEQGESVLTQTLDSFAETKNILSIDLLKIDAEGSEYTILLGASNLLKGKKINHIQFEFGGAMLSLRHFFKDFYDLLSHNYQIFYLLNDGIYPINQYHEKLENFCGNNFYAKLRQD